MSRLLSAFFTRVARAHAGRAPRHSTPAACRPPNSADGSHLTSALLPPPAVYQNPDDGVARPADMALVRKKVRRVILKATAPPNELSLGAVRAQAGLILCSCASYMAPAPGQPAKIHSGRVRQREEAKGGTQRRMDTAFRWVCLGWPLG